jgi:hypothetical protein
MKDDAAKVNRELDWVASDDHDSERLQLPPYRPKEVGEGHGGFGD